MRQLLLPCAILILLAACKEKGPAIDFTSTQASDTSYLAAPETAQPRNVLIEEATGVKCSNCPKGAATIRELQNAHPGRVVAIGLHAGSLTSPFPYSQYDFRTEVAGQLLNDYFGIDPAKPAAVIDRTKTGGDYFIGSRTLWASTTESRLNEPSRANITINSSYNEAEKTAVIKVRIAFTETVTQKQSLTVGIMESGMIDPQEDGIIIDTFYTHNHVLRGLLTPYNGASILRNISPVPAGQIYERTFIYQVNEAWIPANCEVFAFIHHDEGDNREVGQAAVAPLK